MMLEEYNLSLGEKIALVLTIASLSIAVTSIFLGMVILWWPLAQFGMVMFCFFVLFFAVFMTIGRKKSVVKMKPLTFGEFLAINLLFFILSFIVPVIFFHARIISTVVGAVATILFFVVCWAVVIVALGKKGLIKKGSNSREYSRE